MKRTFSKQFLYDNSGCYLVKDVNALSFLKEEMTALDVATSEIPLNDKYWFVCKKLVTREENQQIAIHVAELVLPIYEKRYPDDKRPAEAIQAAKQFIGGHIAIDELIQKRQAAATAAAIAGTAATAAYAAVDAAIAAAGAHVTYDAANAANAADDVVIKQQLLDYLISICK